MTDLGRWMTIAGAALMCVGLLVWGLGKAGFRGLPGDIRYESEHTRVYFPIVTCLVISVVGTLLIWVWQWIRQR